MGTKHYVKRETHKNIKYDELKNVSQQEIDKFMQQIIEATMRRFNMDYGEASGLLHRFGMWDMTEPEIITTIGDYRGVDHFVEYMEECLKNERENLL